MKAGWMSVGLGALAMTALVSSGCSKSGATTSNTAAEPTAAHAPSSATATASGSPSPSITKLPSLADRAKPSSGKGAIVGYVVYQGKPPKAKPINFGAEKICADLNRDKPALYETLVVNPNSTVKGTFVTIRGKVPGEYSVPDKPVVIDQAGCIFTPHVAGVLVGQEVEFRNSDPVAHNIRGTATRNNSFNTVFSSKEASRTKFDAPELGIPLKCDIHFWMSSYLHVSQHPYFAITGDDGSFVIADVPPGEYTLLAWHETLKTKTVPVIVKAGEVSELEFVWPSGR